MQQWIGFFPATNLGKNPLLDYSIFLKDRQEELIHEKIILHNHELIQKVNDNHEIATQKCQCINFRVPARIWAMASCNQKPVCS